MTGIWLLLLPMVGAGGVGDVVGLEEGGVGLRRGEERLVKVSGPLAAANIVDPSVAAVLRIRSVGQVWTEFPWKRG